MRNISSINYPKRVGSQNCWSTVRAAIYVAATLGTHDGIHETISLTKSASKLWRIRSYRQKQTQQTDIFLERERHLEKVEREIMDQLCQSQESENCIRDSTHPA